MLPKRCFMDEIFAVAIWRTGLVPGLPVGAKWFPTIGGGGVMANEANKGPASYFPSIESKYGRPIAEWQELVRKQLPATHMELVAMLKAEHGMGHGHANALVAHTLAANKD